MSKIRRGGHSAEGETLSAGRVEYLEAARARVRTRRIRRTVARISGRTVSKIPSVRFPRGQAGANVKFSAN